MPQMQVFFVGAAAVDPDRPVVPGAGAWPMMGLFLDYVAACCTSLPLTLERIAMADERKTTAERTEDPTPKRLDEAIKRGDVVKSQEVNTWFMIAGGTLVLMVFATPTASSSQATLRGLLANSYAIPTDGPALVA